MKRLLSVLVLLSIATAAAAVDSPTVATVLRMGNPGYISADLVSGDVTGDGIPELVGCSVGGAPFALSKRTGSTEYDLAWMGPSMGCANVAVGDLDGDGIAEIAAVKRASYSVSANLAVFSALSLGRARFQATFTSTSDTAVDVAIANVDADADPEIVVVGGSGTIVYNGQTLAVEWNAVDRRGTDVAVADLEGDGQVEIIVNSSPAHVLNAYTQTEKWAYLGGFGTKMAVGDVDGDGKAEIAYRSSGSLAVFDADTFTSKWSISAAGSNVLIADANNDGTVEVIAGDLYYYGDKLRGYRGTDGVEVWNMANPTGSSYNTQVTGIGAGDVDGDGVRELFWGGGYYDGHIYVTNVTGAVLEWKSGDWTTGLHSAIADVDGDGALELILAYARTGYSSYSGRVEIYDLATRRLEATLPQPTSNPQYGQLAVGQLDADPALEIAVIGGDSYTSQGRLFVWDGITHALQWESPNTNYNDPKFTGNLIIANVDADPVDEIIVGTTDSRIEVLNGATPIVQFLSNQLTGTPSDFDLGDINGDSTRDLVVSTYNTVYVFETSGWTERTHFTLSSSGNVAVAPDASMFFVTAYNTIHAYSGATFVEAWSCTLTDYPLIEWMTIAGQGRLVAFNYTTGALTILPAANGCANKGSIVFPIGGAYASSMYAQDIDGDGRKELLMNRDAMFEIYALGLDSESLGDANGDTIVSDADIDALAQHFYGDLRGLSPAADVDGDDAITQRDLFYLVNYRKAGGPAPLP